jgi:hypothetical protein
MSVLYKIHILDTNLNLLAELDDYTELTYTLIVNAPGVAEFSLGAANAKAQYLVKDNIVQVYRKNLTYGITDWVLEFSGHIRALARTTQRGADTLTVTALGLLDVLNQRIVAYHTETEDRSIFYGKNVETIMKLIVQYNCTEDATTANGRVRNGAIPSLTVETDYGRSEYTIDWANAWKPVLKDLQDLAIAYKMDFDITDNLEFKTYPLQRGIDRTSEFTFSLENGNMTDPVYTFDATQERSVAIVGGQGEQDDRDISVVNGDLYHITSNNREMFVDVRNASDEDDTSFYEAQLRLKENEPREDFSFKVLQLPSCYYGKDYALGDRVRCFYNNTVFFQKISRVTVRFSPDNLEEIMIETERSFESGT